MKSLTVKSLLALMLIGLCSFTIYLSKKPVKKHHNGATNENHLSNINIRVDDLHPGIKIPSNFLGLSYEVNNLTDTVFFKSTHVKYRNLISGLGDGILRLNGYYVNIVPWAPHRRTLQMTKAYKSIETDTLASSDLDTLFSFIRPTKWKVILGVNLSKGNPDLTYSEMSYAWSIGTDVVYAFEIGNENDHNAFGANFADYYSHFMAIIDKTRANNLPVKLCGPATVHPTEPFLKDFMAKAAKNVAFITIHDYFAGLDKAGMDNKSVPELLDNRFIEASKLATHITDSLVSAKHMHYRISECNNYADAGVGVSDRFASALWGIDYMFTVAQNNATGVNFHGGGAGFTPILVKRGQPVVANPLYYAMLLFHLASQGQLLPVDLGDDNPNFKAYAVLGENKKVYVTLINKDVNNSMNVKLSAKTKYATGKLIRLSAPSIYSLHDAVSLAGAQVDDLGKWKQKTEEQVSSDNGKFTLSVPAGSAALLTISN